MEVDPSNVSGEVVEKTVETHRVNWEVNVSHLLLFVAVAYGAYKFGPALLASSTSDESEGSAVGVEIEGTPNGGLME